LLSYQHGYHAGNFADVHKHLIVTWILESLNAKSKPWSYLETHAGCAFYDLSDEQALKTGEFQEGVAKLWGAKKIPAELTGYMSLIKNANANNNLAFYPGSPAIAKALSRDADRLAIMELHPGEVRKLKAHFYQDDNVAVHHRDGYEGVLALLPPKPNRGLVLIDPSYEVKTEYQQVANKVVQMHKRWPNGSFAIWYPLLSAELHEEMKAAIVKSGIRRIYCSELWVKPEAVGGMFGSGMLLVNPPWQIDEKVQSVTPWLRQLLGHVCAKEPLSEWLVPE
jgi:23S rRNA (adenine2030-N6)-methyltransferase